MSVYFHFTGAPIERGAGLCPRGGAVAVPLPDSVSWARPHRSWGLAFPLPFWRWRKLCRRGGGGWTRSVLNERGPRAVLPVGRGGGGVFRAGAFGPGPKNKPAAGQSPAAGGWATPTRRRPPAGPVAPCPFAAAPPAKPTFFENPIDRSG